MWKIEDAIELYGIDRWGNGFFSFNRNGNLIIKPTKNDAQVIDLKNVVDNLVSKKINFPILFRFPQILEAQINHLHALVDHVVTRGGTRFVQRGAAVAHDPRSPDGEHILEALAAPGGVR